MSSQVPDSIGKYIVEKQLGQGAMGVVYLCSQPIVDRKVAVKRVQTAALDNPELIERFLREASAAGNLHHENIVVVHTVEEDDEGRPFIVMEYLDGQDLGDMLRDPDGLPRLRLRLEVAFQVASALDHAHQNSVVHRDVKPSNVIVLPGGRVKLVDFGIARIGGSNMTMDGSLMGTPQYMAPEQWEGKLADGRSDIYAFGILLYELLAGHVPYDAENPLAIGTKILDPNNPPLHVDAVFDGSAPPDGINEIIAHCTERAQDDRPASFGEVRAALRDVLASLPEQDSFESMSAEQVEERIARAREQLARGQHKRAAANLKRARAEADGEIEGITELERQVDVVRLCSQAAKSLEDTDIDGADKAISKALSIDPTSEMARRLAARVLATRSINDLVVKLRAAHEAKDYDDADHLCERILALDPEHGFALRIAGEIADRRAAEQRKQDENEVASDAQATIVATAEEATIVVPSGEQPTIATGPSQAIDEPAAAPAPPKRSQLEPEAPREASVSTVVDPERSPAPTVAEPAASTARPAKRSPLPLLVAGIVLAVAAAAWFFLPRGTDEGTPVPAPALGSLQVTAPVAAAVQIESLADGIVDLESEDDACPTMACPPLSVQLAPGDYIVRWRRLSTPAGSWDAEDRVTVQPGQSQQVFWRASVPAESLARDPF